MKNTLIILIAGIILSGCVKSGSDKLKGDDQMVKAEQNVKTDEISAIKEAVADLKASVSAQAGLINKTMTDNRETSSGRDSVFNDSSMINLFIIVFAITVGVPYLSILLIFYLYMRYNEKAQRRLVKQEEK